MRKKEKQFNREIDIVEETARNMFPEIHKGAWTFYITFWSDGDYLIEYFHTFPNLLRVTIRCKHGEVKLEVFDTNLVKNFKNMENIYLFDIK